jgi:uncharacterized protein (TIGR03000 family)
VTGRTRSAFPDRWGRLTAAGLLLALVARAAPPAAGGDDAAAPPDRSLLLVRLPADAALTIGASPTRQTGPERLFVSPPLEAGKRYRYTLKAQWTDNGQAHAEEQDVVVQAGARSVVVFGAPRGDGTKPAAGGAAKSASDKGWLLRRPAGSDKWEVVDKDASLSADDLVIGLPGAALEGPGGATRLRLLRPFDSPLPVMEPGVVLHKPDGADLDFTLDRGTVELTNLKKDGPARVRIRAREQVWDAVLDGPGATLLVQEYSCWPKGARFTKDPEPKDVPLAEVDFLVLKGAADLKAGGKQFALSAPPGPAAIGWDSVTGMDPSPQRVDEPPAWALPPKDEAGEERERKRGELLRRIAAAAATRPVGDVADELIRSKEPLDRYAAVIILTATDDLPRLAKAVQETTYPDVWDNAIKALRHWSARSPGQDKKLYDRLVESKLYTPREAEEVLQLLHTFSDEDAAKPALYERLIDLLGDDHLALRALAYWHLSRLVPEGQKLGYDPTAPKDQRDKAQQQWKELIPPGKLPPAPKEEGK